MRLEPFKLERWFARYEFKVKYNLAASCARATSTEDLLRFEGDSCRDEYLRLPLDYTENPGHFRLREAIAEQYENIGPDQIQVTTGASEAIFLLMNVLLEPGDNIVVQQPIYQSLYSVAKAIGVEVRPWKMREENGFLPSLEKLPLLIDSKTKLLVINSPHSPTGMMFTKEQLKWIVKLVEQNGKLLVSDEVYAGLVYHPRDALPPAADLSPCCISIGDITKPYGLGGLRVGWIACDNGKLLEEVSSFRDYTTMCCAVPSEFLAIIALRHREKLLKTKIDCARRNMDMFSLLVNRYSDILAWVPPKGGMTAFPSYSLPMDSYSFCRGLVDRKDVLLLPGSVFGWENHFRIGFGAPTEKFSKGLQLLDAYLEEMVNNMAP